jgi:hypothetical protein
MMERVTGIEPASRAWEPYNRALTCDRPWSQVTPVTVTDPPLVAHRRHSRHTKLRIMTSASWEALSCTMSDDWSANAAAGVSCSQAV